MELKPYRVDIRFSDIDVMGHVNNATYFTYAEQARIHFFQQLVGDQWNWNKQGILVARNEMDYKLPIHFNDAIDIHVYCKHIGNKSYTMGYRYMRGEELCATGASVLVCFDYEAKCTVEVPERWRVALESPRF
jgi:acyl-CoA thioester hydrolase